MIEIRGLKKKFQDNIVLDGVDLSIKKGDIIGIIGPSGTGKSTLLRSINLLEKPEAGTISIDDITISLPLKGKDKKGETVEEYQTVISTTKWNDPSQEVRADKNFVLSVDASINPLKGLLKNN